MSYPEIYPPEDDSYHPTAVARTMFIDTVDHEVAKTIVTWLTDSNATTRVAQLRVLGGAISRVPEDATAYAHRASRIMANIAAFYEGPHDKRIREAWVTDFSKAIQQGDTGAYVNFLAADGPERIRNAYPGATYDRLQRIKARYDPSNLFRLNNNIAPA
jgi:FAD/FMN-containing dehydrogenase